MIEAEQLIDMIHDYVKDDTIYIEKAQALIKEDCDGVLEEFLSWFEDDSIFDI